MKPYTIVALVDCRDDDNADTLREEVGQALEDAHDSSEFSNFDYHGADIYSGDLLADYRKLHDMLSNMIEGGRLKEIDIPDDYAALVRQLAILANRDV